MFGFLLDILFPEYCVVCGSFLFLEHHGVACRKCWNAHFFMYTGRKCSVCGHPVERGDPLGLCARCRRSVRRFPFDRVEYFTLYDGLPKLAIKALKFERKLKVAHSIGKTILHHLRHFISRNRVDMVVPVPMHPESLKERGFNQCEEILKSANIRYVRAVNKVYKTPRQFSLPEKMRLDNLKGAFALTENVAGKRVLVFDDVFTTGATAGEVAKTLKGGGADKVFVYTVAYTPRWNGQATL
jgi:ComF family protein